MKVGYGSDHAEAAAFVRRVPATRASPRKTKRVLAIIGIAAVAGGALVAYRAVETSGVTLQTAEPLSLAATQSIAVGAQALALGTPFLLRQPYKKLCVDDGGGRANGQTEFTLMPCDAHNVNQGFTYDAVTKQIRNVDKNLCVDDGGGSSNGQTKFHLWDCSPTNDNQKFEYDAAARLFRSQAKANMCMDDGGSNGAGSTQLHLWECSADNINQQFEVLPLVPYAVPDCLHSGHEIVVFLSDKPGLCMDDGGGSTNGQTKFVDDNCDGTSLNQVFVYDAKTYQFRSARKPGMCLDDGGGKTIGEIQFHLWECDASNINQRFVYEEATQQIRNPAKNLCMDDGGGSRARQSMYMLNECDVGSANQRFSMLLQTEAAQIAHGGIAPPAWTVDNALLETASMFIMRSSTKGLLCVDDGGGTFAGQTQFHLWDCSMDNMNQVFRYDPATYMIHSATKADLCLDDGGSQRSGENKLRLWMCDPSSDDQKFVYDSSRQMLRNPAKGNLCVDDGGGHSNGETKFQLSNCAETSYDQHFSVEPWTPSAPPDLPGLPGTYAVPAFLRGDQEVVIFSATKPGVCVDDGGGRSNGQSKFMDGQCDGNSGNQIFVYDAQTYQFRSARKPFMCVDDGGSGHVGDTQFHLWECDPSNINQRFIYDEATQQIRNPEKNWCMDDTNGQYTMQHCDSNNVNQRFAILWQTEVGGSFQKSVNDVMWWPPGNPVLESNDEFMLRVPGKDNLCMDDGGGESQIRAWTCDPSNLNQVFRYDTTSNSIRSAAKASKCVDDGGGHSNGETNFRLWDCDANSHNQKFIYDLATQGFRNPTKPNMCMDDGGGVVSGQTKFHLWDCDASNPNQRFEIIPRMVFGQPEQPVPMPGMPMPQPIDAENSILMNGGKFMLRQASKGNLCVDDGGGMANGETKFVLQPCDPLSPNQQFVYDTMQGMLIRSARKDGMCVDDGGGHHNGETKFHLWSCDPSNANQHFKYDASTMMFHAQAKDNLCMDDGGGWSAGETKFHLWECDPSNFNQKFEVMSIDDMDVAPPSGEYGQPPPPPPPVAGTWPVEHPILLSGEAFMMSVPGKTNLCVDDGGGWSSGETKFHVWTCDSTNVNQAFRYDASTNTIRSAVKANLCVDDGGAHGAGETKFHLWMCDPSNMNQKFVYDWNKESFYNPLKPGLCMDDGGGEVSGQTQFQMWRCDGNRNQHFEILPISAVEMAPVEALEPMLPDIEPPVSGNRDDIVGPAAADVPPMPMEPVSPMEPGRGEPMEPMEPTSTSPMEPMEPTSPMEPSSPIEPMQPEMGEPIMPVSVDEPADENVKIEDGLVSDPEMKELEPEAEPLNPVDPANPHPIYEKSEFDDGDWNLLAPSKDTIGPVNVDNSDAVTSDEIYGYLMATKDNEDKHHAKMMFRYRRTFKCVTDGLENMSKVAVTATEYHTLVAWMYDHCTFDGRTAAPLPVEPGMPVPPTGENESDRVYMTKLEFYQQIKDHFAGDRENFFGKAESARLRTGTGSLDRKKLMMCMEEAAARFGREKEYEQPENFHNAVMWVQTECLSAGSP